MDSPVFLRNICILVFIGVEIRLLNKGVRHECYYCCRRPKPSPCFILAVADEHWRVIDTQRLTRTQFERWFLNRAVGLVVMEACGSAHHWGRWLNGLGIEVRLLPAQYIRAYVKRNKTDAADAAALLEATRASDRSVLRAAKVAEGAGKEVCGVRRWALDVQARGNHNKAACALANKLARTCYATLRDREPFGEPTVRMAKKINRESFVMPA